MVGVGPFGLESVLARVTVVNFVGDVVLDEFVLPQEPVTDWRTAVSGVRKEDMVNGALLAPPFIVVCLLDTHPVVVSQVVCRSSVARVCTPQGSIFGRTCSEQRPFRTSSGSSLEKHKRYSRVSTVQR
jgi:hypothetical protein